MKKNFSSTHDAETTEYPSGGKKALDFQLTPNIKINFRWIIDVNKKLKLQANKRKQSRIFLQFENRKKFHRIEKALITER